jgi:pimeloyl-ACP methyl ester carboxylesterase
MKSSIKPYLRYVAALLGLAIASAPALAVEDGKFADFGGIKIHYIDRGQGEPIVLLHGGTSNLESWVSTGVVADLAKNYRVIAFDARGSGRSDKPRDPKDYGRQQALDVPRLLDALKLPRAHIVGFSLGSSTVAQLLTLRPERFLTATQAAGAGRSPKAANDPRIEVEASEIEKGCISRSRLFRQAPPNAKPTEEDYRKAEERCRADKDFDQYSVAASLRGYRDQAVTLEQMAAVKVPTLGIVGTLDHTLKEMQNLAKARPDMKFVLLDGVSHTGATGIQRSPGLVKELRTFIAAQRIN